MDERGVGRQASLVLASLVVGSDAARTTTTATRRNSTVYSAIQREP